MPKYYCDYCKSYLTHDTMSVRKSHLIGKNHIKNYCNYYELKAKELGIWDNSTDDKPNITLKDLNKDNDDDFMLPPPNHLTGLPLPPKSIFHNTKEYQKAIYKSTK
ncbi:unnamed protein product [Candida verbasci]|uniref:Matrin-type domain-containing protein n=1 Tax=Candida verbasci TaxID=1227364 RepID=A0A9W4X9V0_9ASCO|nr:unnamed protein product [Candida verbasci]